MKIRNGFVTNSSSSSFIIALKDDQSTSFDAVIHALEYATNDDNTSPGEVIKTVDELTAYYLDGYSVDSKEELNEADTYCARQYRKLKALIEKGYVVVAKYVDYSDYGLVSFMHALVKAYGEDATIIEED